MNYTKIYDDLISKRQMESPKGYTERHHVVPKCMGGSDLCGNIVILTPEEHFLAHLLLCKIHPGHSGIAAAAMFMCGGIHANRGNNKTYGWLRKKLSVNMKINNPNAGGKARLQYIKDHGRPPERSGYILSESGRKKLQKFGSNNPMKGMKPWNHGRATNYTKSVWKQADIIYEYWNTNGTPSYARLYRWHVGISYNSIKDGTISPYMSMYKYFLSGWNPSQDPDWVKFNTRE